jgi:chromosome segregation ATPase
MDLRTEGLDKILEPLAPAMSADVARVLEAARRELEAEFRTRVQTLQREVETAAARLAEIQQDEMRSKLREQLTAEFNERMRASEQQWENEKSRLQDQVNLWRTYAEAQRQMAEGRSQVDVLSHFLDRVETFAPAVALYVSKADGLTLWKARGKGAFPAVVSENTIDPEAYFRLIVVREKTVAAVCARPPFRTESLDFLASCLTHAVETFGMRLQNSGPASS